ncbi:MAG: hypothetical protein J2P36_35925, partial [Ktedonobacteraceae bacterium]|nr:hypothetical protein [Ktedonobacteraceae bacterium]
MSNQPALIYTSGDNARLARMTLEAGWLVGMRSDKTAYVPINFMDVDYRCPNFERHLAMVREHRPQFAVVPDLSHTQIDQADITRALHQAERLQSVMPPGGVVLLVPKLLAQVSLIPQDFALGYSIPSTNGKALYYPWSLQKRRIHL